MGMKETTKIEYECDGCGDTRVFAGPAADSALLNWATLEFTGEGLQIVKFGADELTPPSEPLMYCFDCTQRALAKLGELRPEHEAARRKASWTHVGVPSEEAVNRWGAGAADPADPSKLAAACGAGTEVNLIPAEQASEAVIDCSDCRVIARIGRPPGRES